MKDTKTLLRELVVATGKEADASDAYRKARAEFHTARDVAEGLRAEVASAMLSEALETATVQVAEGHLATGTLQRRQDGSVSVIVREMRT